jgi:hypothetical protein
LPLAAFEHWKLALDHEKKSDLEQSEFELAEAAQAFFEEGTGPKTGVARAFFEYSTLMDAFATVQEARILRNELNFEKSLEKFVKASEILRATVHFAYLAGYISGCASLETAGEMESREEMFQGFKNAIALFEQSKLALSFRDEQHPSLRSIEALIKFAISRALLVESQILSNEGSYLESSKKMEQSKNLEEEFAALEGKGKAEPSRYRIEYLPKYECERALEGALLTAFPEATSLWIGNVGKHPAAVESLGKDRIVKTVSAFDSITWPLKSDFRGKLRISYADETTGKRFDEGCLTVI